MIDASGYVDPDEDLQLEKEDQIEQEEEIEPEEDEPVAFKSVNHRQMNQQRPQLVWIEMS